MRQEAIMNFLTVDKQILLINTIVKSLKELVSILKIKITLNDQIYFTIAEILNFLQRVLKSLPELLISNVQDKYKRQDLLDEFDMVYETWVDFNNNPDIFFEKFDSFAMLWDNYENALKKIEESERTIFLSLN